MDLFERRNFLSGNELGEIGRKGTVRRTKVRSMEIWRECFGKERANIGRADSNAITAILIKLELERLPNKIRMQDRNKAGNTSRVRAVANFTAFVPVFLIIILKIK